jgi:hypothetical protein
MVTSVLVVYMKNSKVIRCYRNWFFVEEHIYFDSSISHPFTDQPHKDCQMEKADKPVRIRNIPITQKGDMSLSLQ